MLFKINEVLFRLAIVLCILYCSGSIAKVYNRLDADVVITQASFQPVLINLWGAFK